MMRIKTYFFGIVLPLMLTACGVAPVSVTERIQNANILANQHDWHLIKLTTNEFTLAAFVPKNIQNTKVLTVYIEGDGFAWLSRSQPSTDPTPLNPIGLNLALQHTKYGAVYLARPCQYASNFEQTIADRTCDSAYWTDRRFSSEVVVAENQAIDQLKALFHASNVELIGYSGGGAIATLVAARRRDVIRLVSVAGNLDPVFWTKLHHISTLTGSLNPADAWENLQNIPQLHLVGSDDTNVTTAVVQSYLNRFPVKGMQPELRVITGFTHVCCWVEKWPALYANGVIQQ